MDAEPFPGYVDFYEESGDACTLDNYTAPATQMDPELQAWLTAQGVPNPSFEAAYTYIDALQHGRDHRRQQSAGHGHAEDLDQRDPPGQQAAHHQLEQQCGRVPFSTYHLESSDGLLPQELALLYVILEVGVRLEVPVPE